MKLRAICIECHERGPWHFTPAHKLVRYSRPIRPAEIEEMAAGLVSMDTWESLNGTISESGRTLTENRKRLCVLVICDACGRSWWTIQRGIVAGWFAHFEMIPPIELEDLYRAAA